MQDSRIQNSVALIGMRGSGKSVVGRILSALLGVQHIDTDEVIVQQQGKTIAEIFAGEGESGFRKYECDVIQKMSTDPPVVISVGGGAILDKKNVEHLRSIATVVWLTAEADVLWQRISSDEKTTQSRPALTNLTGLDEIKQLLQDRSLRYEQACTYSIDTTNKKPEQVAQEILNQRKPPPALLGK